MVGCLDSHARHPVHKARETGWPCAGPLPLYGVWPHLPDIAAIFYHLLAEVGRSRLCSSRPRYYSEGNRRKTKQRSQGSQPTLTMDIHPYALMGAGPSDGIQTHEPRGPEPRVLSTELHPDVELYPIWRNPVIAGATSPKAVFCMPSGPL